MPKMAAGLEEIWTRNGQHYHHLLPWKSLGYHSNQTALSFTSAFPKVWGLGQVTSASEPMSPSVTQRGASDSTVGL